MDGRTVVGDCEKELYQACHVLFGPTVSPSREFLLCLRPSGIKSAFRRQALLTHPDRHRGLRKSAEQAQRELFIASRAARDTLLAFVEGKGRPPAAGAGRNGTAGRHGAAAKSRPPLYHRGRLPQRPLRTGEFLFYHGTVSWETLIAALVWQRRQRPRLGDLALDLGWLEVRQTEWEALPRRAGEPVGEAMVRRGLLTRGQLNLLLWRQRQMQRALGEFFVRRRHLSEERLAALLERLETHNASCRRAARA